MKRNFVALCTVSLLKWFRHTCSRPMLAIRYSDVLNVNNISEKGSFALFAPICPKDAQIRNSSYTALSRAE